LQARHRLREGDQRHSGLERALGDRWREYQDLSALLAAYSRLTTDDVSEALAHYEAHRPAVDEGIRAQLADA
jgi:hypothetical protein